MQGGKDSNELVTHRLGCNNKTYIRRTPTTVVEKEEAVPANRKPLVFIASLAFGDGGRQLHSLHTKGPGPESSNCDGPS
jgi:hypothetical protein